MRAHIQALFGLAPAAPGLYADAAARDDADAERAALLAGFGDPFVEIGEIFADGDLAFAAWRLTGTHVGEWLGIAPTGRRIAFGGLDMARVRDGRIVALWRERETLLARILLGDVAAPFGGGAGDAIATHPFRGPPRSPADPARLAARRARARTHIAEMWGGGRVDLGPVLYEQDAVDHNPAPGQRPGLPGILDVLVWLRDAVTDLRMEVHDVIASGDHAADRWTISGTHDRGPLLGLAPRGRPFRFTGMDCVRFNDADRITDVWHVEAFDVLRKQIG